jgi:hypothetical protein
VSTSIKTPSISVATLRATRLQTTSKRECFRKKSNHI